MNLQSTISIYGGGPGSGCNPEAGKCGRPGLPSDGANKRALDDLNNMPKEKKWRKFDQKKVGGYFRKGAAIAQMYESLVRVGDWMPVQHFEEKYVEKAKIANRIEQLRYTGKRSGLWELQKDGDKLRIILKQKMPDKPVAPQRNSNGDITSKAVTSKKDLGGGINKTYVVTFEDGSKGVFKVADPNSKPRREVPAGQDAEREVAAYKVAKLVGMDDLVPETIIRKVDGERGSLQSWVTGELAANSLNQYDGEKDAARAAAFDYVIGNSDRHKYNWMVSGTGGNEKLHLIDHGLTFPVTKSSWYNASLLRNAILNLKSNPSSFAAPYVVNKNTIDKELADLKLSSEARKGVQDRIENLNSKTSWKDLSLL